MTKEEFFAELGECLTGEVSDAEYADSLSYYKGYFQEEMANGKSEEEVIRSLGSPRLIAKSIIDAHGLHAEEDDVYTDAYESGTQIYDDERSGSIFQTETFQKIKFWCVLAVVLVAVGLVIRILLPFIIVFIVIGFIFNLFRGDV